MKKLIAIAAIAGMAAACGDDDGNGNPGGPSNTGPIVFTVQLSAQNEVPPITNAESPCRGTATITFNVPRDGSGAPSGAGTANFAVQISQCPNGVVWRAAHIHPGAAGVNGGVLVDTGLTPATAITLANGSATASFNDRTLTQQQAVDIYNNPGGFYFKVHSNHNGGGFARGQLVRTQ
jgi:hypothetical protein